MPAALLEVETDDFVDAARAMYRDVADPVAEAVFTLTAALAGTGGMAGSDPGGRAWADSYDRAAKSAITAGIGVANGCYHLSAMFAQTARNYEAADTASTPRPGRRVHFPSLPDPTRVDTNAFPPRAGGTPDLELPGHWSLVAHLVPHIWPNGHQDRLRHAAHAWGAAATAVANRAFRATLVAIAFPRDRLPEADDMLAVCQGMTQHLNDLANVYQSLAHACREMARHIDTAHSAVEGELGSLIAQSAAIQSAGFLASFVTFGLAEVPTQGIEAGRIALAAARITALLEKFGTAAQALAVTLTAQVVKLDHIAAEMRGLYGVRLTGVYVQAARALPGIKQSIEGAALAHLAIIGRRDWPRIVGILQTAARRKGMFGLGEATPREAQLLGRTWVGEGAHVVRDNGIEVWISRDGLRQYRVPHAKGKIGKTQANFEWRPRPTGRWLGNGHLDIVSGRS